MGKKKHNLSSQKGAQFERMICQKLSLWVSGLRRKDLFWRSAMSGGRSTRFRREKGVKLASQAGDISAIAPEGNLLISLFTLECKHLKALQADRHLYGFKGKLLEAWGQARLAADNAPGTEPLLIAKENRHREIVGTTSEGLDILDRGAIGEPLPVLLILPGEDLWIFSLQDLLTMIDFDKIRRHYGDRSGRERL
jgi:hypothetical protein